MDNDAFKQLVRSKVKSTKDIAREAVEEAFDKKRKRKGGRRRGGGSGKRQNHDEDYSSSESESEDRLTKKKKDVDGGDSNAFLPSSVRSKRKQQTTSSKDQDGQPKQSQYRDRAKERREGSNADYEASRAVLQNAAYDRNATDRQEEDEEGGEGAMDSADLSKYLGGDEAHTHLVKGLDVALARSVREKMNVNYRREQDNYEGGNGSSCGSAGSDGAKEQQRHQELKPKKSLREAYGVLQQHAVLNQPSRVLDPKQKSILDFYTHYAHDQHENKKSQQELQRQRKEVRVSLAGSALQRTHMIMAVDWHPANIGRSWEVPVEDIASHHHALATAVADHARTALPKVSPLSLSLIRQMQAKQNRKWHKVARKQEEINSTNEKKLNTHGHDAKPTPTPVEEESDDDDIFPDAGDDSP